MFKLPEQMYPNSWQDVGATRDLEAEVLVGLPDCVLCTAMSSTCASRSCTAPSWWGSCVRDTSS